MGKMKIGALCFLLGAFVLGGCEKAEKEVKISEASSTVQTSEISSSSSEIELELETSTKEVSSTKKSEGKSTKKSGEKAVDFSEGQESLKEKIKAKGLNVIYENTTPIVSEANDASITIDGYQYLEVTNFSRDNQSFFGGQNKTGDVVLLSVTITNNREDSIYIGLTFTGSITGYYPAIMSRQDLLREPVLGREGEVRGKETITGFVAIPLKPEAIDKIAEYHELNLEIPSAYNENESTAFRDPDTLVLRQTEVTLPLSNEGEEKVDQAKEFYEDKATVKNMGTKTLITSKEPNETVDFEGIKITLDGYQVVDFVPNEDEVSRFRNFETGVVLLTAKVTVKNSDQEILRFSSTSGTLTFGNSIRMMSTGMLEVNDTVKELELNQEATKYLVFAIDKESYDKLYKDQDCVFEVSIVDESFARMNGAKDIIFELQND